MNDEALAADLLPALRELPLVGVLRRCPPHHVGTVVEAAVAGGLRVVEITMDSADATRQLAAARSAGGGSLLVGAGTVRTVTQLEDAARAGAAFVVCPTFDPDLVAAARDRGLPVVPAGVTPTELAAGWAAGATLVKLFPAGPLGPGYLRSLLGPLPELEVLVTGGIPPGEVRAFLDAGATGVGVGSEVFRFPADAATCPDFDAMSARLAAVVTDARRSAAPGATR